MEKQNYCPVCGFELGFKVWDAIYPSDEICPCCGTHFGYDDCAGGDIKQRPLRYVELRKIWIGNGMKWFSKSHLKPKNWKPKLQLKQIENI